MSAAAILPDDHWASDLPSAAEARIRICYAWRHRRLANLAAPTRFTELVQLRKLHDHAAALPPLMDKLAAKDVARGKLGPEWVIPTAWSGDALCDRPEFSTPAIIKARHGCNQNAILREEPDAGAWARLQRKTQRWPRKPYGLWLDEWAYRPVPRGLIAEPLVGDGESLPRDYKIYVFGGRATHVQVHLERETRHRWMLFDRDWRRLVPTDDAPSAPHSLPAMLAAAETLSAGRSFMRVDFYEVDRQPLFGEFCLYPGSGLDPFAADWIDIELGDLWHAALQRGGIHAEDWHVKHA